MNEPITTITGNVGTDPELRHTKDGKPWCFFRVASARKIRDASGELQDGATMWISCKAFGEFAENLAKTLSVGVRVVAYGRLYLSVYDDSSGISRQTLNMDLLDLGTSIKFATAEITKRPPLSAAASDGYQQAPPQAAPSHPQATQQPQQAAQQPPRPQATQQPPQAAPPQGWQPPQSVPSDPWQADFGEDVRF